MDGGMKIACHAENPVDVIYQLLVAVVDDVVGHGVI